MRVAAVVVLSSAGAMIGIGVENIPGWAIVGFEAVLGGFALYGVLNERSH